MSDLKLLRKVFDNLDLDQNGVLTPDEVISGMEKLGFQLQKEEFQSKMFSQMDQNNDGTISFEEFVKYVDNRKQEFYQLFDDIAHSRSWNEIDQDELTFQRAISMTDIRTFLYTYKIKATDQQINSFLNLLDESSEGYISFSEFQAFFALLPRINNSAVFESFKYQVLVEHGNDEMRIPRNLKQSGEKNYHYKLVTGAIAGFVSRTVTAPIDRLKILMQFQQPGSKKLGFIEGLLKIYKDDGVKGYFKGNGINCIKKVPEIGIKFYTFDFLLQQFSQNKHTNSNFERVLSGGIAGGISQFLVYPLEMARVRYALVPNGYYKNLVHCIYQIVRHEGLPKLYAGLVPTLIGIFPYAGIDIGVYSIIKNQYCKKFQNSTEEPTIINLLVSGMLASAMALVATAPIHIIRTRLQSNGLNPVSKRYKGPIDVLVRTYRKEGMKGFYRGTCPALVKIMPATSISYIVYEKLNKLCKQQFNY